MIAGPSSNTVYGDLGWVRGELGGGADPSAGGGGGGASSAVGQTGGVEGRCVV